LAAEQEREATEPGRREEAAVVPGLTARALVASVVLSFAAVLWVRQVELINHACQISESVPPVPAIAALLLLLALSGGIGRAARLAERHRLRALGLAALLVACGLLLSTLGTTGRSVGSLIAGLGIACALFTFAAGAIARHEQWFRFSRQEILVVYCFLAVSSVMPSVGVARMVFPAITTLRYFATPSNLFEEYAKHLPAWYAPTDEEVIRMMYEGTDNPAPEIPLEKVPVIGPLSKLWVQLSYGTLSVPWNVWGWYASLWGVFLLVLFVVLLCVMTMFHRQWTAHERLTFPLVQFPLELTRTGALAIGSPPFFKDPIMWIGFGLAVLHNVMNIAHAVNPSVPALGYRFNIGQIFTERPWDVLRGVSLAFRPELYAFAYLVPTDVGLSVWLFYFVLRAEQVLGVAWGIDVPGYPFDREQCVGSYLALGIFLIWAARRWLVRIVCTALRREANATQSEVLSWQLALCGALGGFLLLCLFLVAAGMDLWLAVLYLGIIVLFALVYARARAEAGAPMVWLFPWYQHKQAITNALGTEILAPGGVMKSMTIFSSVYFLSRGFFSTMLATQLESMKIADEARISHRRMLTTLITACAIGLAFAYWMHLATYYEYGCNVLEGGSTEGGYRTRLAVNEYTQLTGWGENPAGPDVAKTEAMVAGLVLTAILLALRVAFLRFPIHPIGFAMVSAYGSPIWGPFLVTWTIKWAALRVGGIKTYRKLLPGFIGLALGHFFAAGIGIGVAAIWERELWRNYIVHFG